MKEVYLVDGSGYIFRAYYAVGPLSTTAGQPTNALIGFTRMLLKLIREEKAEYLAVAFDTGEPTFRHELYPDYKANRAECPDDLRPQMPYFRSLVKALGVPCFEKIGVEADDIIATLARNYAAQGCKVVVVSGDKDLTQLVGPQISVLDAMRQLTFTLQTVKEKFGVTPAQMTDFLALMGDSSDNIPGVKGIGPKSASKLLEHFGSVAGMLDDLDSIKLIAGLRGAKSLQKKIESNLEMLRLSRQLVSLKEDVEPYHEMRSVEELRRMDVDPSVITPLFEKLEFYSMLPMVEAMSPGSGGWQTVREEEVKDFHILTAEELPTFAQTLSSLSEFAFDTETSSLDVLECQLVGISFSWEAGKAFYLPLFSESAPESSLLLEEVFQALNGVFADSEIGKIGVNLKFDLKVLKQQGFEVQGLSFDAMLASHLLNPDSRSHGLKALAKKHLKENMLSYKEVLDGCENIAKVGLERVAHYACHDAEMSFCLKKELAPLLDVAQGSSSGPSSQISSGELAQSSMPYAHQPGLRSVFQNIEMPLIPVLADIEMRGIKVDDQLLAALGEEFSGELQRLSAAIKESAGADLNLNSPKQISHVLFEKMGIPTKGVKKTNSGFSTNASVLERLAPQYEVVAQLLEYRELQKLNSTYIESLRGLIHPRTGRIHASLNQAVAATGRLSSSEPNLQNIPIRNPRGRRIRSAFVAEPGNLLCIADYSQIELRVLAHLSQDESLCEAFRQGEDIHRRTARELFGYIEGTAEEEKELRRIAKTLNFGIIYGMGAFRLSKELGVSFARAKAYIDDYFSRYPKVLHYFEKLKTEAEEQGFVSTMFGRRRFVSELDTSGRDSGYAARSMINAPIQGTASEIIKISMIGLHERLRGFKGCAYIVLQVHDELLIETSEDIADEIMEIVVEEMEAAVELDVPLKVEARLSRTWG